jgi:hypothetical protein
MCKKCTEGRKQMKCSDEISIGEDEISIGEYVRTETGHVGKLNKISTYIINNKDKTLFSTNFGNKTYFISYKDIIKHSFNIIDLIELGDYVNGYMVLEKFTDPFIKVKKIRVDFINRNWQGDCSDETYSNDEIETIITKEQIKKIEFRIKE